jgi:hypothetical protein
MDDDKVKRRGSSGSGKSPTKFMERPVPKPGKKKDEEPEQSHPEFINDDLDALESQEKDEDVGTTPNQGGSKPKGKAEQKPGQRKSQESEERDSSSDDTGGCACP